MKFFRIKEPVNTLTHFITFLASILGLIVLIQRSQGHFSTLVTMTIYGTSVILLFGASSLYHWVHTSPKRELLLKKIDHCAIYLLIAGSYTPVFFFGLYGFWKWIMLCIVWALAVTGIVMKIRFTHTPRYVSTCFYVALGWIALIPFIQLIKTLPKGAILLMFLGGVWYTIGAIIYATKWLNFFPNHFGFHEIFHLFIMGGAATHFVMMILYIIPIGLGV